MPVKTIICTKAKSCRIYSSYSGLIDCSGNRDVIRKAGGYYSCEIINNKNLELSCDLIEKLNMQSKIERILKDLYEGLMRKLYHHI
jgi:hypothetical protein